MTEYFSDGTPIPEEHNLPYTPPEWAQEAAANAGIHAQKPPAPVPHVSMEPVILSPNSKIEISWPGDMFDTKFGAARLLIDVSDLDTVPLWFNQNAPVIQKIFNAGKNYQISQGKAQTYSNPTSAAAPQSAPTYAPSVEVQPQDAATYNPHAPGNDLASVQRNGKNGPFPVMFPYPVKVSKNDFCKLGVELTAEETGIPESFFFCFDNREDMLSGKSNAFSPGAVKFSNAAIGTDTVPALIPGLKELLTYQTAAGKPYVAGIANISWSVKDTRLECRLTKEFTDNVGKIHGLIAKANAQQSAPIQMQQNDSMPF